MEFVTLNINHNCLHLKTALSKGGLNSPLQKDTCNEYINLNSHGSNLLICNFIFNLNSLHLYKPNFE